MEKNYKSIAATQGLYLGLILTLVTVVAYALMPELFTEWWFGILMFLLVLVFGIIAVTKSRKIIDGFMNFKQAFTAFFIAVALGTFISTIVSLVIFNFIDPETAEYVNELTVEMQREMMASFGAPQSEIDKAMLEIEKENQFSLVSHLTKYVYGLAFYAVIGLIIGLIFRQKDPSQA